MRIQKTVKAKIFALTRVKKALLKGSITTFKPT